MIVHGRQIDPGVRRDIPERGGLEALLGKKFLGRIELWESAEVALRRCLERAGFAIKVLPGEGAFYGPKIGFDFRDVLERSWTLATVQIDCAMPERFELEYVTPEGTVATPVMLPPGRAKLCTSPLSTGS